MPEQFHSSTDGSRGFITIDDLFSKFYRARVLLKGISTIEGVAFRSQQGSSQYGQLKVETMIDYVIEKLF